MLGVGVVVDEVGVVVGVAVATVAGSLVHV